MSKTYCTCKRAICICIGLIAGLGVYEEYAIADDDGRPIVEAEAAPGTHSITNGATLAFNIPTGYGETVTDGEAKAVRMAETWAVTRSLRTEDATQSDVDFWGLIKPQN